MRVNEADAYSKESIPSREATPGQAEEAAGYREPDRSQRGDASRFLVVCRRPARRADDVPLQMETLEAVLPGKRVVITDDRKGGRRTLIFVGYGDLLKVLGPPTDDEER
jgi:hypothetical protein